MSTPAERTTAIVVSYNTCEETLLCVASLREHGGAGLLVTVVDNASHDGTAEALRARFPEVRVEALDTNRGFGAANNVGFAAVRTPYVLLINSDARLCSNALPRLIERLDDDSALAVVGPKTLNEDRTTQLSWGQDLGLWSEWRQRRRQRGLDRGRAWARERVERESEVAGAREWVSASAWAARTEALRAVGGFDEGFFLYEEDVDLCRRLRCGGWGVAFEPGARVIHKRGRSMRHASHTALIAYHASHLRYYQKHLGRAQQWGLRSWMVSRAIAGTLGAALAGDAERVGAWRSVLALAVKPAP